MDTLRECRPQKGFRPGDPEHYVWGDSTIQPVRDVPNRAVLTGPGRKEVTYLDMSGEVGTEEQATYRGDIRRGKDLVAIGFFELSKAPNDFVVLIEYDLNNKLIRSCWFRRIDRYPKDSMGRAVASVFN